MPNTALVVGQNGKHYEDALHALCPYFAMFPPSFAREAIEAYSKKGDLVLDPFSGRGTTLYEARLLNRRAIANDINPVAVCITTAKTKNLNLDKCLSEIEKLREEFKKTKLTEYRKEAKELPEFFHHAYEKTTLLQVLWIRKRLADANTPELIFIKTLCLGYLHGETSKTKQIYFSNNLPHTYCPKPGYSVRFWQARNMKAPKVDIFDALVNRCIFRLSNSRQEELLYEGHSILGDVRDLHQNIKKVTDKKVQLVITSPPYIRITSYEEDQWLRLWFLGGEPFPSHGKITQDDIIRSQEKYIDFLADSWKSVRKTMKKGGIMVCRIGQSSRDKFPLKEFMKESIKRSGNKFKIMKTDFSPFKNIRQSKMFGNKINKDAGEFDFVVKAI
ncbi:MAG TPA: DNA methyltransferase [Patescibacteria group bacterium]|nr:DNA methyltransferase [Patescibacteria group bacterium]